MPYSRSESYSSYSPIFRSKSFAKTHIAGYNVGDIDISCASSAVEIALPLI